MCLSDCLLAEQIALAENTCAAQSLLDGQDSSDAKPKLPRIAVVGEVAPEQTTGGDLLLYRLLAEYPSDRVLVVNSPLSATNWDRRLAGVRYLRDNYLPFPHRAYATRFHPALAAATAFASNRASRRLGSILRDFGTELVVSVPQGFQWQMAAKTAAASAIPLVMVCHDDWLVTTGWPRRLLSQLQRVFGNAYRAAAARLAVCQSMADLYEREYGVEAEVLWPSRGPDSPLARVRVRINTDNFVVAFMGSIFRESYLQLGMLADAVGESGEVHIYSAQPLGSLATRANVKHGGFVPAHDLADRLAETADALFVSMDFDVDSRRGAITSFPSKIADYSAIGLPMLLFGPEYCSAVQWARSSTDVAVVIDSPTVEALTAGVQQLKQSRELRERVAAKSLEVGNDLFNYERARDQFWQCLRRVTTCTEGSDKSSNIAYCQSCDNA